MIVIDNVSKKGVHTQPQEYAAFMSSGHRRLLKFIIYYSTYHCDNVLYDFFCKILIYCRSLREARDMAFVEKDRAIQSERDALGKHEQLLQE